VLAHQAGLATIDQRLRLIDLADSTLRQAITQDLKVLFRCG
jgi:hypothetical protein